jgi:hypothetical protein
VTLHGGFGHRTIAQAPVISRAALTLNPQAHVQITSAVCTLRSPQPRIALIRYVKWSKEVM